MIVVNLMGGLGNQMFQFATGLALQTATGQQVRFAKDSYCSTRIVHGFELDQVFRLEVPSATPAEMRRVLGPLAAHYDLRRAAAKWPQVSRFLSSAAVFERDFAFVPDLPTRLQGGGYLHGYWQSESYFANARDSIESAFQFRNVAGITLDRPGAINVSLHVRRGDYMNAGSVHATCTKSYYMRALSALDLPPDQTVLHVFSDDPDWARAEVSALHPDCRFVAGHGGTESYKDMYLMSLCDHHIIANSSFSWWGAWLNRSPDKRVVAPEQWFSDPKLDSARIIPAAWQRV